MRGAKTSVGFHLRPKGWDLQQPKNGKLQSVPLWGITETYQKRPIIVSQPARGKFELPYSIFPQYWQPALDRQ